MTPALPKVGQSYRIWKVVEELVVERYGDLKDRGMRGSFYLVREWLNQKVEAGEIEPAEFDYFLEQQEYYRDDKWPAWERRHGIRRPTVRPPTVVIERGTEYTADRINADEAWSRSRGFIFVEKSGMADDLTPLSEHGWLIVAGKGESTREFRERAARDGTDRPILVVTDADYYGGGIAETLKGHSRRTEHLGLWRELGERTQRLGLTTADADALDLPKERDPTKSPDEWRTELNALVVLTERRGIEAPLLPYVVAKMREMGVPICPLPYDNPEDIVRSSLRRALEDSMAGAVQNAVDAVMEGVDVGEALPTTGEGERFVQLRRRGGATTGLDLGDLEDELEGVAQQRLDRLSWWHQSRYEQRVVDEVGEEAVETIGGMLG